MFVVLLKFAENMATAGELMDGHNQWIKKGFDEGVFLLVGSLQPQQGGAILASNITIADLQERVNADPFVAGNVVTAEIMEISPARTDDRLSFLMD